jgi:hypothetical protein
VSGRGSPLPNGLPPARRGLLGSSRRVSGQVDPLDKRHVGPRYAQLPFELDLASALQVDGSVDRPRVTPLTGWDATVPWDTAICVDH